MDDYIAILDPIEKALGSRNGANPFMLTSAGLNLQTQGKKSIIRMMSKEFGPDFDPLAE
jgi:hypothetical protein